MKAIEGREMIGWSRVYKDKRLSRAILGLDPESLNALEKSFTEAYLAALNYPGRQRPPGGGRKGHLHDIRSKLIFILVYLKCYPTFDIQGLLFYLDRTRACRWVHKLLPLLEKALGHACVLPARQIRSVEEFFQIFPGAQDIFIDTTERPRVKPKNPKHRRKTYSGKKKQTTRKLLVVTDESKRIGFLAPSKNGRRHDKRLLDKTGIIRHIPKDISIWVDTGFQGLKQQHSNTQMPMKSSKNKPLSPQQKENNKVISGIRVVVEHAIGGIKRLACMSGIYRNRKAYTDDLFAVVSAGIWNLHLRSSA